MNFNVKNDWADFVKKEVDKPYFVSLMEFLNADYQFKTIYPKQERIFAALNKTSLSEVKVVIIGQDPYHSFEEAEDGVVAHAHGLCFSVPKEANKIPPSLKNIFKEIKSDLGFEIPKNGDLTVWAEQGVLLLNATLTVEAHQPGSHQKKGWEIFTDKLIQYISKNKEEVVFLLWGKFAQNKEGLIDSSKHFVLKSTHPSPFSAHKGFLGCKHFSETNRLLKKTGKGEINWQIK